MQREHTPEKVLALFKGNNRFGVVKKACLHGLDFGLIGAYARKPEHLRSLEEVERDHLVEVLTAQDGNVARAARVLGIARSTLYARLKKYGLEHLLSSPEA